MSYPPPPLCICLSPQGPRPVAYAYPPPPPPPLCFLNVGPNADLVVRNLPTEEAYALQDYTALLMASLGPPNRCCRLTVSKLLSLQNLQSHRST